MTEHPSQHRRSQLGVLTGAKWASNTALRFPSVFLPNLERAFGTTTGTLTTAMGVGELAGLTTLLTGPRLDRGHERTVVVAGLCGVVGAMLIAVGGSTASFAAGYAVLVVGVANITVAGHAWIAHRFEFARRGRALGVFEVSWALALLLGAPAVAILIHQLGWRAPFLALAGLAALAVVAVIRLVTPSPAVGAHVEHGSPLDRRVVAPLVAAAAIAATGLGLFVVAGAWLDDRHGVSTGGLGAIAAAYGAVELGASSTVALASDRIGAKRSVAAGVLVLLGGCGLVAASADSRALAIAGLLVFLAGFEYAFVSSLTLITEAAPNARGRTIALSNAVSTLARSGSVVLSGRLYEAHGIGGSLTWVAATASVALILTGTPGIIRSPG